MMTKITKAVKLFYVENKKLGKLFNIELTLIVRELHNVLNGKLEGIKKAILIAFKIKI